jgi:hypothetical protein
MLSRTHYGQCQHAPTSHPHPIFADLFLGAAQDLGKNEPESEPEQFIEKTWLTGAQKSEPEQLIENKWSRVGQIFYSNRT